MVSTTLALAFWKEATYAVTPTLDTADSIQLLRLVSDDLNSALQRDESNEIRNDAQSSGSILTNAEVGGSVQLQWSTDTYDDFLPGLLYANAAAGETGRAEGWEYLDFDADTPPTAVEATAGTSIEFDASSGTFTRASASWGRTPVAGELVFVSGFGNRNLDTVWQVSGTPTTTTFTVVNDTGTTFVAYTGVATTVAATTVTIQSAKGITANGTTERSYGVLKTFSDISLAGTPSTTGLTAVDWAVFTGMIPASLQLSAAPAQAGWTGSLTFFGKQEIVVTDATADTSGFSTDNWENFKEATTTTLINTLQNVKMVRVRAVGGAYERFDPLSLSITLSNNAQGVGALRNLGAVQIQQGTFSAQISMSVIYNDETYHLGMLNDTAYELDIAIADPEGNCQIWRFPRVRPISERPNPGKNQVVQQTLNFSSEAGGVGYALASTVPVLTGTNGRMLELTRLYEYS